MNDETLVAVFDALDEVQALLYRSMLEEAGIDVEERPYETPWFESVKQHGLHSQLLVRRVDEERARTLIDAFHTEAEDGTLAIEDEKDSPDA